MKRHLNTPLLSPALAGLLLLPAVTVIPATADTPVAAPPAPVEKKAVSAGLLNDAVRLQTPPSTTGTSAARFASAMS